MTADFGAIAYTVSHPQHQALSGVGSTYEDAARDFVNTLHATIQADETDDLNHIPPTMRGNSEWLNTVACARKMLEHTT